jgi:hypothetical protein
MATQGTPQPALMMIFLLFGDLNLSPAGPHENNS